MCFLRGAKAVSKYMQQIADRSAFLDFDDCNLSLGATVG